MAPVHQNTNNNHVIQEHHPEGHEPNSLIVKLYSQFLANNTVQNGIKQITRFSQPIIGKFDTKVVQITYNMRKWVANKNIYNKLANVWLSLNLPIRDTVVSYQTFDRQLRDVAKSAKKHDKEFVLIQHFYIYASEIWKDLKNPSEDALRNVMLGIIAKTISKSNHFGDDSIATALYNMIIMLIEKRRELVSGETFLQLVRLSLGEDYYKTQQQAIATSCHQYYTFAKTFLLVDYPLVTNNKDVLKMIISFIQDSSFYYGDTTLNFIEKRVDFLLALFGQKNKQYMEDHTISEKAQRIIQKIKTLSVFPFRKVEDAIHQVRVTGAYSTVDKYLHIDQKIDYSLYLTGLGLNLVNENLLQPSLATFNVITNMAKSQVTVIVEGLDVQLLKKKYSQLHARYEVLQKCVVIVADETVKLIFDKKALLALEKEGKDEINRLYHELKTLETEKIVGVGVEYYSKILKKAKQTYNTASKAIYYQKKEIGDQEGANAVRPSDDPEVEAYDNTFS